METYKLKNPFTSIFVPLFGLISLLCVYPYIIKAFYLLIIPIVIISYGSYLLYIKVTYRIIIDDLSITISKKVIPWNKIQKIVEYKQMVESGSGVRKVSRLSIIYNKKDNEITTITITTNDIDKPVAIINSIKKRINITTI
jgi:hypothetical protein